MNQLAFVLAAYAVSIAGTAALMVWSWLRMRSAERAAEQLKAER